MSSISVRYLGSAVGLGFGVAWMAVGLGPAIVCLLLAALGYGVVFVAERARAEANARRPSIDTAEPEVFPLSSEVANPYVGQVELDEERYSDLRDDATAPLAAEAEYGWPLASDASPDGASVAR